MLAQLLAETPIIRVDGDIAIEITGIATDSRSLRPGEVFVACPGQRTDGRRFIEAAIAAGAAAVICEPPAPSDLTVPLILVPDAHLAVADLASAFYGHPSRQLGLIGVTGTDGKTTTTHLIAAILNAAGLQTGLLSTVALGDGRSVQRNRTAHTTPPAPVVQRTLAQLRDAGAQVAVLEVSSHALALHRVHRCLFDCAVFTNLDPEHLDFHRTLENYRAAKARLFTMLGVDAPKRWGRLGVVNRDDPSAAAMRAASPAPCIDFGLSPGAGVYAEIIRDDLNGTIFRAVTPLGVATIQTTLPGRHNVQNWLAAIAAATHFGATLEHVQQAAATFHGVPGRLEPVQCGQPFQVFVDFAHTPQALATTLGMLRRHVAGRLIVLFGQAGHRDRGNRRRMAAAVAANADLAVITSDDPYDEDPQAIVDDLAGLLTEIGWSEERQFWRIVDRRAAIAWALQLARSGDCVLLAGRGPEEETVIAGRRIPLVDAAVARAVLTGRAA